MAIIQYGKIVMLRSPNFVLLNGPRWGKASYRHHDDSRFTVAWRSVLLPARCFTSQQASGGTTLHPCIRDT